MLCVALWQRHTTFEVTYDMMHPKNSVYQYQTIQRGTRYDTQQCNVVHNDVTQVTTIEHRNAVLPHCCVSHLYQEIAWYISSSRHDGVHVSWVVVPVALCCVLYRVSQWISCITFQGRLMTLDATLETLQDSVKGHTTLYHANVVKLSSVVLYFSVNKTATHNV